MEPSNYAAVFDVTRGLRKLLHSQLELIISTAVVTVLPPGDKLKDGPGVNLYLYRVDESPFTRNAPWPGDRDNPPGTRPPLGLVLSYLLTPLGRPTDDDFEAGDDAHMMLGVAMMTLNENPVLTQTHIPGFDADLVFPQYVLDSFETVKVRLLHTSLEELSKIWATINQPYRLSVAYEVSLVELTPSRPPESGGGIVLRTGLTVVPIMTPTISELDPPSTALARVAGGAVVGNEVTLRGSGFAVPGRQPVVSVGGTRAALKPSPPATNESLTIVLPTSVNAGPDVDVVVSVGGRESVPATLTVTPWLARSVPVRTALDPNRDVDRKLILTGSGFVSPLEVRFTRGVASVSSSAFDETTAEHLVVQIPPTLANGRYDVRVVLGDAASSATNARTLQVVPRIDTVAATSNQHVHTLTIDGARFDGVDVRLSLDGVRYSVPAPSLPDPSHIVFTLGRLLDPGAHELAIDVDGNISRPVSLEVGP